MPSAGARVRAVYRAGRFPRHSAHRWSGSASVIGQGDAARKSLRAGRRLTIMAGYSPNGIGKPLSDACYRMRLDACWMRPHVCGMRSDVRGMLRDAVACGPCGMRCGRWGLLSCLVPQGVALSPVRGFH